jgi:putative ABC transport system permease protein
MRNVFVWLDDVRRDVGYAVRTLRRAPAFTAIAVLTLALGIGAVTVIYSVVRNVLLDPFPYRDSDRMVDVVVRDGSGRIFRGALPAPEFLDYQEQSDVFEEVLGTQVESMHYVTDAGAERLAVGLVTPNMSSFLGVGALVGRVFGPADAAPGAPRVGVLNHRSWVSMFGADAGVVGSTITLNGEPRTIIGVMPPRFEWNVADLWIPAPLSRGDPDAQQTFRWFQALLRPGVTIQEAEAQLNVIAARRAVEHPREYPEKFRVQVITVIDWVVGQFRRVLYTLFAAVGLLLVIACCNVANMLLARATAREREIAVRAALGASRGRIVRQLLVESGLLALGGVVSGSLLAYAGVRALARLMPRQGVPWETELRVDQPVLLFALCTGAVATLAFGLFPAANSVRRELVAGSSGGGRSGTAGPRQTGMRSVLVVAEVALSIVLLLGAGLLMQTFFKLVRVDLGFDPRNLLVTGVAFAPGRSESAPARQQFYREALERIHTVPGVSSAAVTSGLIGGMRSALDVPGIASKEERTTLVQFCSEGCVEAFGLHLLNGRRIAAADVERARKVALVNDAFVKRYFGAENPIGRTVRLARLASPPMSIDDPTFEIAGVLRDVANQGIRERALPQVYVPSTLSGAASLAFVVRTTAEPMRVLGAIRQAIRAVDRQVALVQPSTAESLLQRAFYAQPRFSLIVLVMFAGTGLVLVALGIYGVLAYTVSQQAKEIAIRIALGGERRHVAGLVLRMGSRLVGAGVLAGLAASLATNRLLMNQLWNTSPHDPITLVAVVSIVLAVGLCACWVPAFRALRVEPIAALRQE